MAAQECLPNNDVRDAFAAEYSVLGKLWEAISPDPMLLPFEVDYRWLTQVYVSVQPTSGTGKLVWHALGAKTIELIHQNVHVDSVRDDLETLVLDAEVHSGIKDSPLLVYEEPEADESSFPQDIKKHFWESVKTSFAETQVIIIENSHQLPGDGTLSDVNVVLFTGNDQGRRGFIPQPAGVA